MNDYQNSLDMLTQRAGFVSNMLQDLVDKQTPLKVASVKLDHDITIGNLIIRKGSTVIQKCPKCGEMIMKVHNRKYCGNCGQVLDWSDER